MAEYTTWKDESLQAIFEPEGVAVVGASTNPRKLGSLALRALQSSRFPGLIYPVNPSLGGRRLGGLKAYSSLMEVPDPLDLVLVAVQALRVPEVMEDCAERGVRGAVIFSAGFRELGPAGQELERKVSHIAGRARIGVVGPNCLGVGNIPSRLNATFFPYPAPIKPGGVSLVSQSGGVAGLMLYGAVDAGLGVAKFASIGNRTNLDFPDFIRYLGKDPQTKVIGLFVEGTEEGRRLMKEASHVTPNKPILAYKVGRTKTASRAAVSHTGSLAGRSELYSAAFRQAGIIEVRGISELIDTAKALSLLRQLPRGRRVAIITHTLGPSIIAAEILEERGALLPPPSQQTVDGINRALRLSVNLPIDNPIDLLAVGWARPDIFAQALQLAANENTYDALLTIFSPNYQEDIGGGTPVQALLRVAQESGKPIITVLNSPESQPPPEKRVLEDGGIPVFHSPERGAKVLANVIAYAQTKR